MSFFTYQNGVLHAEQVSLPRIAEQFDTPCYVYSRAAIETQWQLLDKSFGDHPHLICYAVKANSNLAVLNVLAKLGSGFDIVSGGELMRVLAAGGRADRIVFSGVGKSRNEIKLALEKGIRCLNIESTHELERIQSVAQEMGTIAPIGLRVNPDVDAQTHPYIATGLKNNKFGVAMDEAFDTYQYAATLDNISIHSMACHIGSQIVQLGPFDDAVAKIAQLVQRLAQANIQLQQLDLGGGLGIKYRDETPPSAQDYITSLIEGLQAHQIELPIAIEPGRYIAGNAGVLLTRIEYLKQTEQKTFAIVDAGMNDLMRPSLYQAYHGIKNVALNHQGSPKTCDVVGPVCESADVLGTDRALFINEGELLAVESAGAYANVMASNYNTRPRPAEVMVSGEHCQIIRKRETFDNMISGETLCS